MKLKTLKEIEPELKFTGKEVREIGLRFTDIPKVEFIQKERDKQLRQEAIKWIKSSKDYMELAGTRDAKAMRAGEMTIMMKFFDIDKEELE